MLTKYLPEKLISKPKRGFGIPLNDWLRGHLKDYVYDTLNFNEIKNYGFYNTETIKTILDQHYNYNKIGDTKYGQFCISKLD